MKSFSLIGAVALAAGVSAQYSAAPVSTPAPTSIPGGCNPAHPGSCPSSYFQTIPSSATPSASKPASSTPASNTPAGSSKASVPAGSVTTTITAKAGCPTGPAPDVTVTRSNAPVPSCEAGKNATKPSVVSAPGYGPPAQSGSGSESGSGSGMGAGSGSGSGSGNGTRTSTGQPAQFTGAAGKTAVSGALALVAGFAAYMFASAACHCGKETERLMAGELLLAGRHQRTMYRTLMSSCVNLGA
ncbi:hypothetical protein BU25DRAFT_454903 [Macroventuria anomochaeta]|uniref:Uncharacterized protein n=1 Tax=Macroventuria anomochaeta TaxID=301207 RepID=A0ACB6SBV3_9PLEO|nr:uncharacterized protein BU25DRAFT_454903 [Macroventuria anomochaeta]KAF2631453.1 hypothetical protein BU25DRAFT_454903 [Macroventuria anomochaeta]